MIPPLHHFTSCLYNFINTFLSTRLITPVTSESLFCTIEEFDAEYRNYFLSLCLDRDAPTVTSGDAAPGGGRWYMHVRVFLHSDDQKRHQDQDQHVDLCQLELSRAVNLEPQWVSFWFHLVQFSLV